MNAQKGFTLIELMMIVAIIGLIAAFALPAFQDYAIRARVVEAMSFASSAKAAIVENASSGLVNLSSGFQSVPPTPNLLAMQVDSDTGVVVVTTTPRAGGGDIALVPSGIPTASGGVRPQPSGPITWTCNGPLTTLIPKFRPRECL